MEAHERHEEINNTNQTLNTSAQDEIFQLRNMLE